jgi:hypothetical protein
LSFVPICFAGYGTLMQVAIQASGAVVDEVLQEINRSKYAKPSNIAFEVRAGACLPAGLALESTGQADSGANVP